MRKILDKPNKLKRGKKENHRHILGFGGVLVFLSAIFLIAQTFLANSLAVQGKEISNYENRKSVLERDLSSLNQQSSQLSSLDSIRALAKEKLGMIEGFDNFDYFGSSVALR